MGYTLCDFYPVESPTIYGGDEEKNVHSLLRVGVQNPTLSNVVYYGDGGKR
jgi:hypothetical protein